ncbi:hypothetical protein [Thalassoglobus polymorphus]|uniref:Uncharacterized protein n=1 Tax=Thalassoglobus polymorphus TaxID=2527994 RepID=A0A517QP97_9PLAN|nr:hypothetical protein [Thalassoglobus polymorphus]QDT33435.1 hypothetical protein Mal48_26880 [Thalassoglobus polymorphus]
MSPLHYIGQIVREALQMIPMWGVRLLFVGTLVALLIWVLRLPESETTPEGGAKRWDENLKLGASLALILQIIVYSFL